MERVKQDLITTEYALKSSLSGTISAVSKAAEARDPYTAGHQYRVSQLAQAIAVRMGLHNDQIEGLVLGAAIHDIGKLYVPAELLNKPARLSSIEYELIKTHANVGYEILKDIDFPWPIAEIARQHHERINGSGYPRGLKGENIILEARIVAIADVVESIASHRPYRPSLGLDKAISEIRNNKNTLFDAQVVDACLNVLENGAFKFDYSI